MGKKLKIRKKIGWFAWFITWVTRTFKKNPKVINLNEEPLPNQCIMIGNHNAANGPVKYYSFLGRYFMTWGAHQMCEGFLSRRRYLYHIFYRQKLGYSKFRSAILAVLFGLISKRVYSSAGIIPVYYDSRLRKTFGYSIDCLEQNVPILIFPEDSNAGYKDPPEMLWPGFILTSKAYYAKHGVDLPIYTIYYSRKKLRIIIGKPMYYNELAKNHAKQEILQIFVDYMKELRDEAEK